MSAMRAVSAAGTRATLRRRRQTSVSSKRQPTRFERFDLARVFGLLASIFSEHWLGRFRIIQLTHRCFDLKPAPFSLFLCQAPERLPSSIEGLRSRAHLHASRQRRRSSRTGAPSSPTTPTSPSTREVRPSTPQKQVLRSQGLVRAPRARQGAGYARQEQPVPRRQRRQQPRSRAPRLRLNAFRRQDLRCPVRTPPPSSPTSSRINSNKSSTMPVDFFNDYLYNKAHHQQPHDSILTT